MKFEDLDIEQEYDSRRDFIYGQFFNKILPHCGIYCRFGGIFSGEKFVQCADGIQEFIKENGGTMELVLIPDFNEKDKVAFTEETKKKMIEEKWKLELDKIKDDFKKNHIKALACMIAEKLLTIKLILPQDEKGKPLTKKQLEGSDLLTEVGIFFNKDDGNDFISFRGEVDVNDASAMQITTSRPWMENEKAKGIKDYEKFQNLWNEKDTCQIGGITCKIQPLSDELIDYFKEQSPESIQDIPPLEAELELRPYQEDAVKKWYENGCKGIFEMATGTGKTWTAIGCIKKMQESNPKLLVVIAAPYTNLVDQWEENLNEWHLDSIKLDKAWTKRIRRAISTINDDKENNLTVLICSHAKFARNELLKEIQFCKVPTMLIVDEAHHVGSGNSIEDDDGIVATEGSRKGLSKDYKFRLGLSATIDRYYDDDGTEVLLDYFKGTKKSKVYNLDLKKAIKDKWLCGYKYHISFVELNEDEFIKYKSLTSEAMKYIHSKNANTKKYGEHLIMERSWVIRDAKQKMGKFIDIMKSFSDIRHLLVFCSHNQYEDLDDILKNSSKILGYEMPTYRRIAYDAPSDKRQRIGILRDFANEDFHMLLSNKVLDEGMDIPEAKACIVLASTGNPTQFIQRRGRVLRQFKGRYKDGNRKLHAHIFDIIVKPNLDGVINPEESKFEIGIIKKQLKKLVDMSELAMNKSECMKKIQEFKSNLPDDCFEEKNT